MQNQWRIQDFPDWPQFLKGCTNLSFCKIFAENLMKTKELGPRSHNTHIPFLDPPMRITICEELTEFIFDDDGRHWLDVRMPGCCRIGFWRKNSENNNYFMWFMFQLKIFVKKESVNRDFSEWSRSLIEFSDFSSIQRILKITETWIGMNVKNLSATCVLLAL